MRLFKLNISLSLNRNDTIEDDEYEQLIKDKVNEFCAKLERDLRTSPMNLDFDLYEQ